MLETAQELHTRLLPLKYPDAPLIPPPVPKPEEIRIFRVARKVISARDDTKNFGYSDLVTC